MVRLNSFVFVVRETTDVVILVECEVPYEGAGTLPWSVEEVWCSAD